MKTLTVKQAANGSYELLTADGQTVLCLNGPLATVENRYEPYAQAAAPRLQFRTAQDAIAHAEYFHYSAAA